MRHAYGNANGDSHIHSDSDSDGYGCLTHADGNGNAHADCDTNSNGYSNRDSYLTTAGYTDASAASESSRASAFLPCFPAQRAALRCQATSGKKVLTLAGSPS